MNQTPIFLCLHSYISLLPSSPTAWGQEGRPPFYYVESEETAARKIKKVNDVVVNAFTYFFLLLEGERSGKLKLGCANIMSIVAALHLLVMLLAHVAVWSCALHGATARAFASWDLGGSCTMHTGMNVSTFPPTTLPRQFATSPMDCCSQCTMHSDCVVAVWYSYYCHLLSSAAGIEPLVPTSGCDVVVPDRTTTTTTTAAPATTTAAPVTPVPTPAVPPPPGLGVIREVFCQSSSTCNASIDNTCITTVYYNSSCRGAGQAISCDDNANNTLTKTSYQNDNCTQFDTSITIPTGECEPNQNSIYREYFCDVHTEYPVAGRTAERVSCATGCNDGIGCSSPTFTTGVCMNNTLPNNLLAGSSSVIAWCYTDYVVYVGYGGQMSCVEPFLYAVAEPYQCRVDASGNNVQNFCT